MEDKIRSFRDLIVWQKSVQLVVKIYKVTESFPDTEKFGLVNQMRRAAVSIPSNIAEGHAIRSRSDFQRFLKMAIGSCNELYTQIEISKRLNYFKDVIPEKVCCDIEEISKMLTAIIKKTNN